MDEGDLGNLEYVDHFGQNDIAMTFLCQKSQRMCRYHMRYTRGWGPSGDRSVNLPTVFIGKVVIQKDIVEGDFGGN